MRPHLFRITAAVITSGLLSLAACSGDDDGDGATADVAPVESTAPAAPADDDATVPGGDGVITISGFAFSGVTEVAVGTTVVVTNDDSASHTWTSTDGSFDSGAIAPGESFEFTFTEPGTFEYVCNFHPTMTGTITVTG
jgi:plastocyanin